MFHFTSLMKNAREIIAQHKGMTTLGACAGLILLRAASIKMFGNNQLSEFFDLAGEVVKEIPGLFWIGVGLVVAGIAARTGVAAYRRLRRNQKHKSKSLSKTRTRSLKRALVRLQALKRKRRMMKTKKIVANKQDFLQKQQKMQPQKTVKRTISKTALAAKKREKVRA